MVKKLLTAVLALSFVGVVAAPCFAAPAKVGDALPEMTITMLSGKSLSTAEMVKKKTVVITFIQTACSSCKGEIIELQKLVKESKNDVLVLPVAVDMRTGKEFLENYKSENAVSFDFGVDPKFSIPVMFGISFTPASIVVQDGKVTQIHRGYDDQIGAELAKLFK